MNIVFINSSDTFEKRVDLIYDVLKKQNHNIKVIASDYMHIEKRKREYNKEGYILLPTVAYKRNISFMRLYSHYKFAKDAYRHIKNWDIDLLYIVVPPNSQAALAKKYKKRNPRVKIVMDIIDLWPESLPTKLTQYFPFTLWSDMRNRNLKYADKIITECDLYQDILKKYLGDKKVRTIYWAHSENKAIQMNLNLSQEEVHLCYLGSINNIIDIPHIIEIIQTIIKEKPVVLKIVGDGEKRQELIEAAREAGAEVFYYGKIYDSIEKQKVFDSCHYGLNIMKDTVCVGLSMKSIDYFESGLPIINNLRGDTEKFVRNYCCGVNSLELKDVIKKPYQYGMRQNSQKLFQDMFSEKVFRNSIKKIIEPLGDNYGKFN